MTSTVAIDRAQRRIKDFQKQCGDDGEAALYLAYHAALPVALNAELLHLLRINFFLDPPEVLPYTVEFEFLLSPLCREIDEGLYEVEPDVRTILLTGLTETYEAERIQEIATLLWQYVEHQAPWGDRIELERAQQLTALNFLAPDKARQWLNTVETAVGQGQAATREWLVAIRQEIENQGQQSRGEESLAVLMENLHHENSNVRRRAVIALGRIGGEEAIAALIHALNDESSLVRLSAALALGKLGSAQAVSALISTLNDWDGNVRAGAVKALGQIGNDVAVSTLISALTDEDNNVRRDAASALGQIGNDVAVDALISALSDEDSSVRQSAAAALGQIGSDRAVNALFYALNDEDSNVRKGATAALGQIGGDRVADALLYALNDEDSNVRRSAVVALGQIGGDDVIPGLQSVLEDSDPAVRSAAAAALERLGHPDTSINGSEGNVLWVDDHPENNTSERRSLEASGVRFVLAVSTGEALEIVQRQSFDLIISDMGRSLDPQAGYTLLERLRAGGDRTPFIIYSSSRYSSNVAEAQARGAIGVTGSPTVLINMVLTVLRQAGQGGANEQGRSMGGTSASAPQQVVETPPPIGTEVKPIEVFISYSYRDADFRDEIVTHLAMLQRQGLIQVWTDREITGASEWATEINTSIDRADLILILVSANLLASDYAWGEEMHRAIARHEEGEAQVIPIILRPVDWVNTPIGELQALPSNTKPVTLWDNRDEAFRDVARGIRAAVERIRARSNISNKNMQQGQRQETYDISGDVVNIYERNTTDDENLPE